MDLISLKGIGPRTCEKLNKLGIETTDDLVRYYPLRYERFDPPQDPSAVREKETAVLRFRVDKAPVIRSYGGKTVVTLKVRDKDTTAEIVWYNAPYIRSALRLFRTYIFRGVVGRCSEDGAGNRRIRIEHPAFYDEEAYGEIEGKLVPVYGLTKGLTSKAVAKYVSEALTDHKARDIVPASVAERLSLIPADEALRAVHFPGDQNALSGARRRLVFEEAFAFTAAAYYRRSSKDNISNFPMTARPEIEEIVGRLPYELTASQRTVLKEITDDLTGGSRMQRIIEGDVGSGKTILAFLAAILTVLNGYSVFIMAPTEVLASQHYKKLLDFASDMGLSFLHPFYLSGSVRPAEKKEIYKKMREGDAGVIVGTHALFSEAVPETDDLALVIIDEQHRFGVRHRTMAAEKGHLPHVLSMSATPIPRTLQIMLSGGMDVSLLRERPGNRLPVKNAVADESYRGALYSFMGKEIEAGRQVYVICPLIEPSDDEMNGEPLRDVETVSKELKKVFPNANVSSLHGRMKSAEKNRVMKDFADHRTDILVSTTVIEVGVDVPNATVMVVENAERFGLAALHQLRGRVGRSGLQSYCIFMNGSGSGDEIKRLEILKKSNDGFEIADEDLKMRGGGDIFGVRQSGEAWFDIADPVRDREMFILAGREAVRVTSEDPELSREENGALRAAVEELLSKGGEC